MRILNSLFLLLISFSVFAQDVSINPGVQLRTLGAPINTLDYSEFAPTISADGKTMIFESDREGNKVWRLYITYQIKPNVWSNPEPLDAVNKFVPMGKFLGGPCLSYDGKTLFFSSDRDGGFGSVDIYFTVRTGNTWSVPKNCGRGVNSSGYDGFPSVSSDGKHLYFMRPSKGTTTTGQHCCSIYRAYRRGSFYMNAQKLPYPINTGCEGYPRIMADSKTLIFSSYRPGGKGGYDLYETKMRAGKWTKPIPLQFINTINDDELITVPESGDFIYLSNTSKNGKDDIYRVELPKEFRPDKIVTLTGEIREQGTNKIIPAKIKVNNIKTKEKVMEISNNEVTGKYKILLQEGEVYDLSIKSKGKTFHSEVIDLTDVKRYETVNNDIKLKPLETNISFTLNNIFFDFDAASIQTDSEFELQRILEMLKEYPNMIVEIAAHTDDKGSDEYNDKLSQARAESVVSWLINKGIATDRLQAKGYGKKQPAYPNDSDENRAKNRRVEFKIIKF